MITLLSDFGAKDYFVPAVKGVILTINPQVYIVDITHEIATQDIASAAFVLGACYHNYPPGTIHFAVVDPGVGSNRRVIVVEAGGYLFVGPDNGIFNYVYSREPQVGVFHISRDEFFRKPVSSTFHGRDVFAPVAAWLSLGVVPDSLGDRINDYISLEIPQPRMGEKRGSLEGSVIHIDRFGNCVTNFTGNELPSDRSIIKMFIAGREITQFGTHYAQAKRKDELFAYLGSAGYWEIGIWCGSAAEELDARPGVKIVAILS